MTIYRFSSFKLSARPQRLQDVALNFEQMLKIRNAIAGIQNEELKENFRLQTLKFRDGLNSCSEY